MLAVPQKNFIGKKQPTNSIHSYSHQQIQKKKKKMRIEFMYMQNRNLPMLHAPLTLVAA